MIVKYDWRRYEMALGRAVSFEVQKTWFLRRRFLRAVKRCFLSLRGWLPVLAVFVPVVLLSLLLLFRFNLISAEDVIVELVLVLLGSFALLTIREFREQEMNRHRKLLNQWEFCTDLRTRFENDLEILGAPIGASFSRWESLSGYESLNNALEGVAIPEAMSGDEVRRMEGACEDLGRAIELLREENREIGFVDCDFAQAGSYLISNAESELLRLKSGLLGSNLGMATQALVDLSRTCLWIVADLRKPWRYEIDIARNRLIERYVERYGVEL